jgi:hypothetical protein
VTGYAFQGRASLRELAAGSSRLDRFAAGA